MPNEILQVGAFPRTLSGQKMELPVKKLLLGAEAAQVLNPDAMANAGCVDWFVEFARAPFAARLRSAADPLFAGSCNGAPQGRDAPRMPHRHTAATPSIEDGRTGRHRNHA